MTERMLRGFLDGEDEAALWAALAEGTLGIRLLETVPADRVLASPGESKEIQLALAADQGTSRVQFLRCRELEREGRAALRVGTFSLISSPGDPAERVFDALRRATRQWSRIPLETYNPNSEHHLARPVKGLFAAPGAARFSLRGGILSDVNANLYYRVAR